MERPAQIDLDLYPGLRLPLLLLSRYLFYLVRRPISSSNAHYLQRRLTGLKTLAAPLVAAGPPELDEAVRLLQAMNAQNFRQLSGPLQHLLAPYLPAEDDLPRDIFVAGGPPPPSFFQSADRILLLLGPAIGIGDELITFPLPRWLKAANPAAHITVLSAYRDLWSRANGVDAHLHYDDYATLWRVLSGDDQWGDFDLVILIDFESPGLHQALCFEPTIPRYVELSLGAQSLVVVDGRRRRLHRLSRPSGYYANYYFAFHHLLEQFGLAPSLATHFTAATRHAEPAADTLQLYVNPFTSKYDPSPLYWSRLLTTLWPHKPARPVTICLDPGPNRGTARFAAQVIRGAAPRLPEGVTIGPAGAPGVGLPLDGVFDTMERSHFALVTDSFAAHAAPLFGCTTLVLAHTGLERWRVPHPGSFYFDGDAPLVDVAAGLRQVLDLHAIRPPQQRHLPVVGPPERQLEAAATALADLCAGASPNGRFPDLLAAYRHFLATYDAVLTRLPHWPAGKESLLADLPYHRPMNPLAPDDTPPDAFQADLTHYIRHQWQQWHNSNLHKMLAHLVDDA